MVLEIRNGAAVPAARGAWLARQGFLLGLTAARRPLGFCLVGASGVAVNTAVLWLAHSGVGLPLVVSAALATETAIVTNFTLNNAMTFRGRHWSLRRLVRFNLASLLAGAIAVALLTLLVRSTGLHYLVASLVAILVGAGINYACSVRFVWARGV